jgi:ADP-L-glycero-D-manno-heptose 6-epimerase
VTGAAGFVGSNLVAHLLAADTGAEIVCIDDCRSGSFNNLIEACERARVPAFTGDFIAAHTASLDWPALLEDVDPSVVFHLAAITDTTVDDERKMIDDNVEGFRGALYACVERGVPLVYASSAATYGTPRQVAEREPFPETAAGKPNNVYGFSKWVMENMHRQLLADRDPSDPPAHVVGLRYFNVFGPGEARKGKMASMAHQLTTQILDGKRPRLFAGGEQARDQVSVHDVVSCTVAAAQRGVRQGVYNCGSGRATTFNELVHAVRAGLGVSEADCPTEYFDMPASVRRFYQDFTCADLTRTRRALDWEPSHDPISATRDYAAQLKAELER